MWYVNFLYGRVRRVLGNDNNYVRPVRSMAGEHPKAEASKADDSKEEHPKSEESKAESKEGIEYGAKSELKSGEKEAKAEEKE